MVDVKLVAFTPEGFPLKFFITARDVSGNVTLHRESVPAALKKADELLSGGYFNVEIITPDGAAFQAGEFDRLKEKGLT